MAKLGRKGIDYTGYEVKVSQWCLTVLKEAGRDSRGHLLWECRCKCGRTVFRNSEQIKNANRPGCEYCYRMWVRLNENLFPEHKIKKGQKFNKWKVIGQADIDGDKRIRQRYYVVECLLCGFVTSIAAQSLRENKSKCCRKCSKKIEKPKAPRDARFYEQNRRRSKADLHLWKHRVYYMGWTKERALVTPVSTRGHQRT